MELPLSANTAGLKLLVMTGEAACANAVPAKDAAMSTAVTIGRQDDLCFMTRLLDRVLMLLKWQVAGCLCTITRSPRHGDCHLTEGGGGKDRMGRSSLPVVAGLRISPPR